MVRYQPPKDWQQWVEWLAAGLHGRNRWRLSRDAPGMVFARGRRTVTHVAAGRGDSATTSPTIITSCSRWDARPISSPSGCSCCCCVRLAARRARAVGRRRFAHQALRPEGQGAGIHHNPTPGPADQKFLYGHIWVTISLVAATSAVGDDRLAARGLAVRARQGHRQDSGQHRAGRFAPSCNWRSTGCCS